MTTVYGFVVTTVCGSVDEFVERYARRVVGKKLFVSVIEDRVLGGECAFAILLANRRPVLAGLCEVDEIFFDRKNPYGRCGMRITINRIGEDSKPVWNRLVVRGQDVGAAVEAAFDAVTSQSYAFGRDHTSPIMHEFEDEA